ncbi:MAG: class I SAM-dependent methyltransferase [Planctomycetota bacterium]
MPTIEENRNYWSSDYDWSNRGQEWNQGYGGTQNCWEWCVHPRIRSLLPTGHILELAPGYGVWTNFLRPFCTKMTLVDLAPNCIEHCRARFGDANMSYHTNDGSDLSFVADGSIDMVFSWNSLVHAEAETMHSYVQQICRKLKPGGVGFIHHSNLGAHRNEAGEQQIPEGDRHWRGSNMTAKQFREDCKAGGVWCYNQEIIPWGSDYLIDCISVFIKPEDGPTPDQIHETQIRENMDHWEPARALRKIDGMFRKPGVPEEAVAEVKITPVGQTPPAPASPLAKLKAMLTG